VTSGGANRLRCDLRSLMLMLRRGRGGGAADGPESECGFDTSSLFLFSWPYY
jgi:hypothetical protein